MIMNKDTLNEMIDKENDIIAEFTDNKYEFEYKGYKAYILRHELGFLNGYLEVGESYPEELEFISHGGITYDNDGIIGFDCAQYNDLVPYFYLNDKDDTRKDVVYRELEYVKGTLMEMIDFLVKDDKNE